MSSLERGTRKMAAVCTDCGELYTVHVAPDGSVDPIGVAECTCGGTTFRPVRAADPE